MYYDVAHNAEGIRAIIKTISKFYPDKKIIGLFTLKSDKNIKAICNVIKNNFEVIIICNDKNGYLSKATDLEKIMGS